MDASHSSAHAAAIAPELVHIWQYISHYAGDETVLYPWLATQQSGFNADWLAALPAAATAFITDQPAADRPAAAIVIATFGNLVQQIPLGQRALNLELAIAAYQQALTVISRAAMPIEWATTLNNLATAYQHRLEGDRADNLEVAIRAYGQALLVRTAATHPLDWATTLNHMATAYADRIMGDRHENLERAIDSYQRVLTVISPTTTPRAWAMTLNHLAAAYADRLIGDRDHNIDQAICTYRQALKTA